jgi:hypothetical protein
MAASYKPEGHSTVSPYLIAAGAQRVIDFLQQTFGARALRRYDMPDGSIMHAEVQIEDTVVMMGDAGGNWPAVTAHVHVYVEDSTRPIAGRWLPALSRSSRRNERATTRTAVAGSRIRPATSGGLRPRWGDGRPDGRTGGRPYRFERTGGRPYRFE